MKRVTILLALIAILGLCCVAQADLTWGGWSGDNWNTVDNWGDGVGAAGPPVLGDIVHINPAWASTLGPTLYDGDTGYAAWFQIYQGGIVNVGQGGGGAVLNIAHPDINYALSFVGGTDGSTGTLNVNSGTYAAGNNINVGTNGTGIVSVTNGGTINGGWALLMDYASVTIDDGLVNIVNVISPTANTTIEIGENGELRFGGFSDADGVANAEWWVSQNIITAAPGLTPQVEFDYGAWQTVVTAVPEPATMLLLGFGSLAFLRRKR